MANRGLLEKEPCRIIENHFDGPLADIFKNELINKNKTLKGRRYSHEIKHFAVTLYYFSPRAYNFCRSILSLPHPKSIRNWISAVNAEPGFNKDAKMDSDHCGSIFEIKWKRKSIIDNDEEEEQTDETKNEEVSQLYHMMRNLDPQMSSLKDNVLFYISGYLVKKKTCFD